MRESEKEPELKEGQKRYLKRLANDFKNDASQKLKEFDETSSQLISSLKEVKANLIEGDNENPSLLEEAEQTLTNIETIQSNIDSLRKEIFVPKIEGQKSLAESIRGYAEELDGIKSDLKATLEDASGYERELLGYTNETGEDVAGIKHKVEGQVKRLDTLHTIHKSKQEKLFGEIEGLLKGASTVALAAAFKDHKRSFTWINIAWMSIFVLSISAMMGLSVAGFVQSEFDPSEMWKYTLGNLPFLGGAIWLAVYAGKQRSQNKRLQQEYAYKEDVAKVYYGLKKEIEELDDSEMSRELNERILAVVMDVVSYNPSVTLENTSHEDKGPILGLFDKFINGKKTGAVGSGKVSASFTEEGTKVEAEV